MKGFKDLKKSNKKTRAGGLPARDFGQTNCGYCHRRN
jgi:hypothetical protein